MTSTCLGKQEVMSYSLYTRVKLCTFTVGLTSEEPHVSKGVNADTGETAGATMTDFYVLLIRLHLIL